MLPQSSLGGFEFQVFQVFKDCCSGHEKPLSQLEMNVRTFLKLDQSLLVSLKPAKSPQRSQSCSHTRSIKPRTFFITIKRHEPLWWKINVDLEER